MRYRDDNTEGYDAADLDALNAAWAQITAQFDADELAGKSILDHYSERLLAEYDDGKRGGALVAWFYERGRAERLAR